VTIPTLVRSRLGIEDGDVFDVRVRSNCVVLTPKQADGENDLSPQQRRAIDALLADGLEDLRKGRVHGPFSASAALAKSMREVARKPRTKPKP